MGRPSFEPTDHNRQTVRILKANGNSNRVIALIVGCDEKTLTKHFREELDSGFDHVKGQIGAAVVRQALQGNIPAAKFWLACRAGQEWKAPPSDDDGGNGGATIIIRGGIASVQHDPGDDSGN